MKFPNLNFIYSEFSDEIIYAFLYFEKLFSEYFTVLIVPLQLIIITVKINNCSRNLLNYRVNMMNNKIKSKLTLLNIDI